MASYSASRDPDKEYIQGLLARYIECAEYLIDKCRSLHHIKGAQKLERKCLAELKFLKSLSRRQFGFDESHLRSSNLSHYLGVIHAAENLPDVTQILQAFRCPNRTESLHVDVVAGQGHLWVKVIARKGQALHLIWAGNGQYGERDILLQAEDYVKCTTVYPVNFVNPTMVFAFYNGVTGPMADELRRMNVAVVGEVVEVSDDVENKLKFLSVDDDLSADSDSFDENDDDFEFDRFDNIRKNSEQHITETTKTEAFASTDRDSTFSRSRDVFDWDDDKYVGQTSKDIISNVADGQIQGREESLGHATAGRIINPTSKEVNESTQQVLSNQTFCSVNQGNERKTVPSNGGDISDMIISKDLCIDLDSSNASRHSDAVKRKSTKTENLVNTNTSQGLHGSKEESRFSSKRAYKLESELNSDSLTSVSLDEFITCELLTSNTVDFSQLNQIMSVNSIHTIDSIRKVNIDVSSLITLVSAVAHGRCHFQFQEPILSEQAAEERMDPVLPKLLKIIEGKELYACQTAVDSFQTILDTLGGESEIERAKDLMKRVKVVPDNPSFRTQCLPTTGKIKERAKVVFGTGDSLQAVTLTANSGFVRAAQHQGVLFAVHIHAARALTEQKEKTAETIEK